MSCSSSCSLRGRAPEDSSGHRESCDRVSCHQQEGFNELNIPRIEFVSPQDAHNFVDVERC